MHSFPRRAGLQLPLAAHTEAVLRALVGIGDRLPEPLGRRLDVDLEHLVHRLLLEVALQLAERGGPGLGVLAHPPVVDEADRDRVQEVELLATAPLRRHEARVLEHAQMLHHAEARHRQPALEAAQRLPVVAKELVQQTSPRGISQRPEHLIHVSTICDLMVTRQGPPGRTPGFAYIVSKWGNSLYEPMKEVGVIKRAFAAATIAAAVLAVPALAAAPATTSPPTVEGKFQVGETLTA